MFKDKKMLTVVIVIAILFQLVILGVLFLGKGGNSKSESEENQASNSQTNGVQQSTNSRNTIEINPASVTALSNLPPSYGLSFHPALTIDNDLSTWWSPYGQYQGQWIQFNFNQPTKIYAMKILNGSHYANFTYNGVSFGNLYTQNSVITKIRLDFSDGKYAELDLKVFDGMQTVEFPEVTTSFVKLTPLIVSPGSRWPDVCISEVKFL